MGRRCIDYDQSDYFGSVVPAAALNFGAEIDHLVRNFIGREWLLERFEDWIFEKESSRIFFITALPGVGKTTLAAYICHTNPAAVAFHFCQYGNQEKSSAFKCVQSLAYQLSVQLREYRTLVMPARCLSTRGFRGGAWKPLPVTRSSRRSKRRKDAGGQSV